MKTTRSAREKIARGTFKKCIPYTKIGQQMLYKSIYTNTRSNELGWTPADLKDGRSYVPTNGYCPFDRVICISPSVNSSR